MFQLLPSGNIQKLMELANDITGVPVLAVDIMYNLLGIAPQAKTGDYYWNTRGMRQIWSSDFITKGSCSP